MRKTIINFINFDWINVKNKCRTTVNKDYTPNSVSSKFKIDLLISEHSPIRLLTVDWTWKNIKSWVATHFSRHKWECFIGTQREDRTGVQRTSLSQDVEVNFDGVANAQNLIDTARKRLCYQASRETRESMEELKALLHETEPSVANVLVPNCVYRAGCPEFPDHTDCKFYKAFREKAQNDPNILGDIRGRYDLYNKIFYDRMNRQ